MHKDPHQVLTELEPAKKFLVGIDSDGCAFDTMEIKHKECFCPNAVKHWDLQTVSKYAREAWDFVNLYSTTRGCNRFLALLRVLDLLRDRNEVRARGASIPDATPLLEWTERESKLGEPMLEEYAKKAHNPIIDRALDWSRAVNAAIAEMVHGIPPFPFMRESLERLSHKADCMVVSQTPVEALTREWRENKMQEHVRFIAGQEFGTKTEHLRFGAKGKYDNDKILMIGDAPGDHKAANSNGVLFYPINPGHEVASWERFYNEALQRFFDGKYAGEYENGLIAEFEEYLPAEPPWVS